MVARQLGRPPRGVTAIAHRCPCGQPDVVATAPRLPDGTPFPTLYYLTCPRAAGAISGLEAGGLMRGMTARLAADEELAADYRAAHEDYLARRNALAAQLGLAPLPATTVSAGGMPSRVKCLHALAAHELAVPGASRLGRETLAAAGPWWAAGPCACDPDQADRAQAEAGQDDERRAGTAQADAGQADAGQADAERAGQDRPDNTGTAGTEAAGIAAAGIEAAGQEPGTRLADPAPPSRPGGGLS